MAERWDRADFEEIRRQLMGPTQQNNARAKKSEFSGSQFSGDEEQTYSENLC
jgi:hypothetical protein